VPRGAGRARVGGTCFHLNDLQVAPGCPAGARARVCAAPASTLTTCRWRPAALPAQARAFVHVCAGPGST